MNILEKERNDEKNFVNLDSWEFSPGKDIADIDYVDIDRDGEALKFKINYKDGTETEWNEMDTKDHFERFGALLRLKSKFGQDKIRENN